VSGARALLLAGITLLAGCSSLPATVEQQVVQSDVSPHRIAVVSFYPAPGLASSAATGGETAAGAADLVTRFVSEALAQRGFEVIPAEDVQTAFEGDGLPVPRADPELAAELAARDFGADAVLLGSVTRFRQRSGSDVGSIDPASVAFAVSLYAAPTGALQWRARFDETQQAFSSNVFLTPFYPGGGTRWLTAAEFAQWGAGQVAQALFEVATAEE
jgi:hypothetical protein